jgi:hypothetical protein
VSSPTASVDLARTALEALGLEPPPQLRGESLWTIAQRGVQGPERARIATTTLRFSARWSGFVLSGTRDHEGKLCNLSLEADCVSDVRATHPLAAEIMHGLVFDELGRTATPAALATTTSASGAGTGLGVAGAATTTPDATGDARRAYALPLHPKAPDAATAAALRAWGVSSTSR